MSPPRMIVIAGPPGAGKSQDFSVAARGVDHFNADDRAAELNGGSYLNISPATRAQASAELRSFIERNITNSKSFSFETTLRSTITFAQAQMARKQGFLLFMNFVTLDSPEACVERVIARVRAGGHSTDPHEIRRTYAASLNNLGRAILHFDRVAAYDNTAPAIAAAGPRRVLVTANRKIRYVNKTASPNWLFQAILSAYEHAISSPATQKATISANLST